MLLLAIPHEKALYMVNRKQNGDPEDPDEVPHKAENLKKMQTYLMNACNLHSATRVPMTQMGRTYIVTARVDEEDDVDGKPSEWLHSSWFPVNTPLTDFGREYSGTLGDRRNEHRDIAVREEIILGYFQDTLSSVISELKSQQEEALWMRLQCVGLVFLVLTSVWDYLIGLVCSFFSGSQVTGTNESFGNHTSSGH